MYTDRGVLVKQLVADIVISENSSFNYVNMSAVWQGTNVRILSRTLLDRLFTHT